MIVAKRYTTKELKAIDEVLDLGDTGASQKPGWYWQEVDGEGDIESGPCGPYKSEAVALREAALFHKRLSAFRRKKKATRHDRVVANDIASHFGLPTGAVELVRRQK